MSRWAPGAGRSVRRLAVLAVALVGLGVVAAPASAAAYVLRPAKTSGGFGYGWVSTPSASTADSVLAKPVTQPASPATSSYVTAPDSSGSTWWGNALGLQVAPAPAFGSGESLTSATAWVNLKTGAYQSVTLYLASGEQPLASTAIASGQPAGWHSVSTQTTLSPTDLGQLTIWLVSNGPTNMSPTNAYAAYVELDTTSPAPTPTSGPLPKPFPLPVSLPSSNPVSLATQTVALAPHQTSVPVTVACAASTRTGCRGTLTLRLPASTPSAPAKGGLRAVASRCARGCRVLGHTQFDILAGHSKRVKVHLAHSASALLRGRSSIKVEATTTTRDATGHTQATSSTLTLTRAQSHRAKSGARRHP
jgi:hypothetical protein